MNKLFPSNIPNIFLEKKKKIKSLVAQTLKKKKNFKNLKKIEFPSSVSNEMTMMSEVLSFDENGFEPQQHSSLRSATSSGQPFSGEYRQQTYKASTSLSDHSSFDTVNINNSVFYLNICLLLFIKELV